MSKLQMTIVRIMLLAAAAAWVYVTSADGLDGFLYGLISFLIGGAVILLLPKK